MERGRQRSGELAFSVTCVRACGFSFLLSCARVCASQSQRILGDANGPLIQWMAERAGCTDDCASLLQEGGELWGNLKSAGIGNESAAEWVEPVQFSRYPSLY